MQTPYTVDFALSPHELLFGLINYDNSNIFTMEDIVIGARSEPTIEKYESRVILTGTDSNKFPGNCYLHYNRIDLSILFKDVGCKVQYKYLASDGTVADLESVTKSILATYGLNISKGFSFTGAGETLALAADQDNVSYRGQITITVSKTLAERVKLRDLDGFSAPHIYAPAITELKVPMKNVSSYINLFCQDPAKQIYITKNKNGKIIKVDANTGNVVQTYALPGDQEALWPSPISDTQFACVGLEPYDFYGTTYHRTIFYVIEVESGEIVSQFSGYDMISDGVNKYSSCGAYGKGAYLYGKGISTLVYYDGTYVSKPESRPVYGSNNLRVSIEGELIQDVDTVIEKLDGFTPCLHIYSIGHSNRYNGTYYLCENSDGKYSGIIALDEASDGKRLIAWSPSDELVARYSSIIKSDDRSNVISGAAFTYRNIATGVAAYLLI